ncbi:MAG TPA: hypothetical protein VFK79_05155 [Xanthobacteraceae bacterium]|nr:hypothetical protein [Xanthobacteraceae bacterium]
MTVLDFNPPAKMPAGWQFSEVQKLLSGCDASIASGEVSGWEIGTTETGDPQLYLLGSAPDYDCILCVSRLGRLYVLEDGNGKILFEHRNLMLLSQQVRAAMSRKKMMIVAKAAILWATVRQTVEEKIEPMLAEPLEIATHLGPQIAALA